MLDTMTSPQLPDSTLGEFLRAHRAKLSPCAAGLSTGPGPRRTPGLRREEVAVFAGVSQNYYTRLECGRETHPSIAVLDALARALHLSPDEHDHLRRLAATSAGAAPIPPATPLREVPNSIGFILESLRPSAAYVLSRDQDILAANPAGRAIFPGMDQWEPERRNITRYLFCHPAARDLYPDTWDDHARHCIAGLRALAGTHPDHPGLHDLVTELQATSPDFARLWTIYNIRPHTTARKTLHHPDVGTITLNFQALTIEGTPGQRLSIFYANPNTPEHQALTTLDTLGQTTTL